MQTYKLCKYKMNRLGMDIIALLKVYPNKTFDILKATNLGKDFLGNIEDVEQLQEKVNNSSFFRLEKV